MDFAQIMGAINHTSALLGLITGMAFVGAPLFLFFQSKLGRVRRAEAASRVALNEEIDRKDLYIAELEETAAKPFIRDLAQAGRGVPERGAVAEEWLHRLSPTLITAYTAMADARHAEGDGAYHLRRVQTAAMGAVAAAGGQEGESTRRLAELDEAIEAADLRETAQGLGGDTDALALDADAARENGDYRRAVALAQKVLDLRMAATGEDSLQTAEAANHLGTLMNDAGMSDQAERHLRTALDIHERVLGTDHPHTARSYHNLASNLGGQGKASEAEPLLSKALDIRVRVLGADHPNTATSYNNMAFNLYAQGKTSEAEPLYRKALDIRERVFGTDHPDTATSYNNVAFNLYAQGKTSEAEPLYRKALDILERVLGNDHPLTKTTRSNLENCIRHQSQS